MRDRKIVILGDVMLDEFVWGEVTRISPEAPVPVVDVQRESVHLGRRSECARQRRRARRRSHAWSELWETMPPANA